MFYNLRPRSVFLDSILRWCYITLDCVWQLWKYCNCSMGHVDTPICDGL